MDNDDSENDFNNLVDLAEITGLLLVGTEALSLLPREPRWTSSQSGNMYITDLLRGNPSESMSILRMDRRVFRDLCNQLVSRYGLSVSGEICVRERVGMFVYTVAHGVGNRLVQDRFHHSGETVSRQFHSVLRSLLNMADVIIKPRDPQFATVPSYIADDDRFFPYFRDCIGAIDGTHIPAVVPSDDRTRYIGRKGIVTQNVMAACDFDMLFTFVCAGWEGSAHDSRIFAEVLANEAANFPHPPPGKYYLVDSGYPNQTGYLAPYRGQRYHLEIFRNGPEVSSPREAFNYYHSSLRSVIERSFGVLKTKWHILSTMPSYKFKTQVRIVVACMALHNFIRLHELDDPDFNAYADAATNMNDATDADTRIGGASMTGAPLGAVEDIEMAAVRNMIAAELFDEY